MKSRRTRERTTESGTKMKSAVLLVAVFFFVALALAMWGAHERQSAPVAQDIGFKDVAFSDLDQAFCRGCHGDSTVETHHETRHALSKNCTHCHKIKTSDGEFEIKGDRDCLVCHRESPHHKHFVFDGERECTDCHEVPGVSEYNADVPRKPLTTMTPTTTHCKGCHGPGTAGGHEIKSIKDTHHGLSLKDCDICHHGKDRESTDIRYCERCHSADALHRVGPHVRKHHCVRCHGPQEVQCQ